MTDMSKKVDEQVPPTEEQVQQVRKVDLRMSNPEMYRDIMLWSIISVGFAINFWNSHPTFNPFGIPKTIVGIIFFMFGGLGLVFLNVFRDLKKIRLLIVFAFIWYFVWGIVNAQQWHEGRASLQLPIAFLGMSVAQFLILLKPPVNPMSEKRKKK